MKRCISLLLFFFLLFSQEAFAEGLIGFARVALDDVNVREAPKGNRQDYLKMGDHVFVLKEERDSEGQSWYWVNYKPRNDHNKTGWVRGDMLTLGRELFSDVVKIAAGDNVIAALRRDGSVVALGEQFPNGFNPDTIHWQGISDIAAGLCTVLGVTTDGRLIGAGNYSIPDYGNAPDVAEIYMAGCNPVVLKKDGTVFIPSYVPGKRYLPQNQGILALPPVSEYNLLDFDAFSISNAGLLGLYAQAGQPLGEWSDVCGAAAGSFHSVLLMRDGTVRAYGDNHYGVCDVAGWTDIIQVACGGFRTVGLRSDGTVVAIGDNRFGECDVSDWRDIVQVACGNRFTVGLTADGRVLVAGEVRFDYDAYHDGLYSESKAKKEAAMNEAYELDAGYYEAVKAPF